MVILMKRMRIRDLFLMAELEGLKHRTISTCSHAQEAAAKPSDN